MRILIPILFLLSSYQLVHAQEITTGILLEEMVNRDALPEYPEPFYLSKQFSSYDRDSKALGENGWFANWDFNRFVREEIRNGEKEFVLFDSKGPGAVVRFWCTIDEYRGDGILRFYLDGETTPAIEGEIISILGKKSLVDYPLASSVAEEAQDKYKSFNLYFPIAYSSSCKITYSAKDFHTKKKFFYNIGYREYEKGTTVRSYKKGDLKKYSKELEKTINRLSTYNRDLPKKNTTKEIKEITLKPSEKASLKIKDKAAIRKISMNLSAKDYEQALRSTILKIKFDSKETVWVPIGDFFGTGYQLSPYKTWYTQVLADGTMSCYWIMPFKNDCEVTIENFGKESINISGFNVTTAPWEWTKKSMYFGVGWFEEYNLHTRKDGNFFDVNYVTLNGEGVLVGTGLTLFDAIKIWWGEGDEKIYVDGESFPSSFGTGTEDFFGYGWGGPEFFEHPFIAQPRGEGNVTAGMTSNIRYRALDAIPFKNKLQFDIEMWHWADTKVNYAPVSYFYMKEGGKSNLTAQPMAVTNPVALKASDLVGNFVDRNGHVEIELTDYKNSGGDISSQSLDFLSYGQQTWWQNAEKGESSIFSFHSDYEGIYNAKIRLTKSFDYSIIRIKFNDTVCLYSFDAYNKSITTEWVDLGKLKLKKGKNSISVEMLGKNPLSKGETHMCGLDCLAFQIN